MLRRNSLYSPGTPRCRLSVRRLMRVMLFVIVVGGATSQSVAADDASPSTDLNKVRSELVSKRHELGERIQKLSSSGQQKEATGEQKRGPADATTELEFLRSLDLIYQSHLAAVDETLDQRRERDLRREELHGASNAKPDPSRAESWLVLEDYRDRLEAEIVRGRTCAHELTIAHDVLQAALEKQEQSARSRRRILEESNGDESAHAPGEQQRRLQLADSESTLADASVELRRAEVEWRKTRQELVELNRRALEEKVRQISSRVTFSEADLQSRLRALANYEAELQTRLDEARQRQAKPEASLAAQTTKVGDASSQPTTKPDADTGLTAETLRMIRRLANEEVELLERWQTELASGRNVPTQRFRLAHSRLAPDEIAAWLEIADKLMSQLGGEEQLLTAREAELMQDLTTLYRQARVALSENSLATADRRVRQQALERLLHVTQSGQLHVQMLRRSGQRFLQELHDRDPRAGGGSWWVRVQDAATAAWTYELAAVGDRPITVGKVCKGLLGLLCGVLLAAFISRLLGKRVLPRLGLNPGAAEALRSLTFYLLSAVFGILSLELANVPLTALTFLGGAAAIAVGFASQDLVGNFMSGVILLAEQPIRVGDFVDLSGVKGIVDRIGARSTRVRTDKNVEITVPNSKLLGGNVNNLTLSDNFIWSSVTISVDRGLPVAQIKDCLLSVVQLHPRVVENPAPYVLFTDFGDKTLKFEVHFSIALRHMNDGRRIESDLREAIDSAFRQAGIIQDPAISAVRSNAACGLDLPDVVTARGWAA
jgi:small-conductance mechanosensitive channel